MLGVVEDRDQLGLLPVLAAGTTQGLAVHGQHGPILATGSRAACSRPPAKMAASQDPAGQRLLQRAGSTAASTRPNVVACGVGPQTATVCSAQPGPRAASARSI
jgi:hypothetical protein